MEPSETATWSDGDEVTLGRKRLRLLRRSPRVPEPQVRDCGHAGRRPRSRPRAPRAGRRSPFSRRTSTAASAIAE
eukprot:16106910-Heterocapsa_arctica.AAC.1